jgi:peroxiredoxin
MKILIILLLAFPALLLSQNNIDFSAETLNGEKVQLSDVYKNGPTLVTFWALWCKPCRAEMKHLKSIYEKYQENGFTILGINQDSPRSMAKVSSFVESQNVKFPIILDPNQEIFQQFNGQSIPLLFLYNTKGEVVYSHLGYLPGDEIELKEEIKKTLELAN